MSPMEAEIWVAQLDIVKQARESFSALAADIDACICGGPSESSRSVHLQDVFCIKAEANGLLDAARCAYVCTVRDMETLVERYRAEHNLDCELIRSATRGYHLSVSRSQESKVC